jgi:HD-like signal output (HDOD) protein
MKKKRIGELLIEGGWVTSEELKKALEIQKEKGDRIGNLLIDLGYLTEENFLDFLNSVSSTATVDLSACEIEPELIDLVPESLARRLELVPIGKIGKVLTVGMVYPLDEKGKQELEELTGLKIRAVVCSRTAVMHGLNRYYPQSKEVSFEADSEEQPSDAQSALKLGAVAKLIEGIEELPTLPEIVGSVSAVLSDPKSSAKDVANAIAADTGLSGKILKLANSPAYGFSRQITGIADAVALIGFEETHHLVMSAAVFDQLSFRSDFEFRSYWKHSLACATLARLISANLKPGGMQSVFISGLLHDMGKVILARDIPESRKLVGVPYSSADRTRLRLEELAFGINHAEAGYLLAEHWLLPKVVADTVRHHHAPETEQAPKVPAGIVFLANIFCRMEPRRYADDVPFDKSIQETLNVLEMSEAALRASLRSYGDVIPDIPNP